MANPLDVLTARQLECLRLIVEHKTSKEIARELGLSSHAIDARVKRILASLNVSSRDEAARIYLQFSPQTYQPLVCSTSDLPMRPEETETAVQGIGMQPAPGDPITFLSDSAYAEPAPGGNWSITLPFRTAERPVNDMPIMARLSWMAIILLATIIAVTLLINVAEGLTRLI